MSYLSKTLGGLSKAYYIRQFLFGLIFFAFMVVMGYNSYSRTGNPSIFLTNIILGFGLFILISLFSICLWKYYWIYFRK